ncbi:MAG: FAD-binding oxidoreductase [Deltaproteobacteria bacterium]|nr:FAD-binding oxidoreductase [Deltaproteobacteria bacterium]MBW2121620.1 FAD-binding oxidoreductase [Deltaproteobacteria bacterium]
MIPREAEVVIIGGGIIGSSVAYFLSQAKRKVVLLERGDMAGEASGANGAFVWTSTRRPGIDLDLALASIEIHKRLGEELDVDTEYRRPGGLLVIENEQDLPVMERFRKEREDAGFVLTMLDSREAREFEPLLSERIAGALYNPLDGGTNPFNLVLGLQRKAEQMGARVFHHTEVQGIRLEDNRVRGVITARGIVRADLVVNACGAWAPFIGEMVGIKIPIIPSAMEFVVTEQMPPVISHIIMGAAYVTGEYAKEEMIGHQGRFGCGLCVHQTVSGNILLGATWRFVGYDKRTSYEETRAIAREVVRLFPQLGSVCAIRSFVNFFPFTSDDLPILGYVEGIDGFVMAAGHCGHGICLGPISGKLISELICEGRTSIPIDELGLWRFSQSGRAPSPGRVESL